ncbi:reverse transcriptase [Gossypium australe]|uniref:Reverse transcriptase n=1 Tax=Gossypium australe TaxID=47621 RepID=A0A5B6WHK3_9ROSI|nr:reverse transcriptase [Gossypium australe]
MNDPARSYVSYFDNQLEEVNYLGNRGRNPYSNTYNPSWKYHPNLKWGGNQGGGNPIQNRFSPPYHPLHMQRAQERSIGNDHVGCGRKEHINAIILHSSKTLVNPSTPMKIEDDMTNTVDKTLDKPKPKKETEKVAKPVVEAKIVQHSEPASKHILFPSRLKDKQRRDESKFLSFLNLFKSLNINFPLLELNDKISKYAKYLKRNHIGDKHFRKALCDLGANINLMPLSTY